MGLIKKGEVRNPQGRPKKSWTAFTAQMARAGFQPLTRTQYMEALSTILVLPAAELEKVGLDEEQPLYLRLLIKQLADASERAKAMIDYRDYLFGKAKQSIDHTTDGDKMNQVTVFHVPDDGRNG